MKTLNDLIALVQLWIDQQEADGCQGCAYEDRQPWEKPCSRCRRNSKDYYRKAE